MNSVRFISPSPYSPAMPAAKRLANDLDVPGGGVARRGGLRRADRREHDGGPQRQDPADWNGTGAGLKRDQWQDEQDDFEHEVQPPPDEGVNFPPLLAP